MSKIGIVVIYAILGAFVGVAFSVGIINQTKKSQRNNAMPFALIGGLAFGIVGGVVIANSVIRDDEETKRYGLDKIEALEWKNGRKWVLETKWINPQTGNTNTIRTEYFEIEKTVWTSLNSELLVNHHSTSGAKAFIEKAHLEARGQIFQQIKMGDLKLI